MKGCTIIVAAVAFLAFCTTGTLAQCLIPQISPFPREIPLFRGVSSCGPTPCIEPIRSLGPLILQPTNGPLYVLPSPPPPPPTVIGHKCYCTKTVVKPRLYQRIIRVQKNQRFLKKTYTPVVEKIPYFARPRC